MSNAQRYQAGQLAVISSLALALAACGGGGGGSNVRAPAPAPVSPPPAAPPAAPIVQPVNPQFAGHLAVTNTNSAHEAGFTGAGVNIGIVDSGVMRRHPALSPRVTASVTAIRAENNNLTIDDVVGHGTAVAQLAAGSRFGQWPGGVAPGANILSARIINDERPKDDGTGQGNEVDGALGLQQVHDWLTARGMRIMNNSWGGLYWRNLNATAPIASEYRSFIFNHDGLVVFASGNEGRDQPTDMASLPSKAGPNNTFPAADLERGWLTVTAVNPNNTNSLDVTPDGDVYANACGHAMRYCLAAPGTAAFTGKDDSPTQPSYWRGAGTSYAAPLVSGAAALVWQAFPYFNNDLVRQTLLGTARDLGEPGVDPVFGYGLLNVGAAVRGPGKFDWGDVRVSVPNQSTWSNNISGAGGLIKEGAGRLNITGASSYTGQTIANAGTLAFSQAVPGSATVNVGGTLIAHRGIEGAVVNRGVLEFAGNTAGTRWVRGNLIQSAGARLGYTVGAPLHVLGNASLAGELQVLGVAGGYMRSNRESVLVADGSINGTFASLSAASGVFLTGTLDYEPNQVWLNIARLDVTAAAANMGLTPASLGSAQRLEGAFTAIDSGQQVGGGFLSGAGAIQRSPDAAAADRSLASLSGELHAADSVYAMAAVESSRHALEQRLDGAHGRNVSGVWGEQLSMQRQPSSHFNISANGWRIGQDVRLGNGWLLGAGVGQTDAIAWHGQRNDREHNRQLDAQLYAAWTQGDAYVMARGAHGRMQRHAQRDLWLGQDRFDARADYGQHWNHVGLQAGYHFNVAAQTRLTPYLGVQRLDLQRGGFQENDLLGFGLQADRSHLQAQHVLLGLRWMHDAALAGLPVQGWGRLEWQRLLDQRGQHLDARFNALDVYAPIAGWSLTRDVGVLAVGLDARTPQAGTLSVGFDARKDAGRMWTNANLRWWVGF